MLCRAATELAEHTTAQATATLGPEHPGVVRLRELTAYIAYLAGDALRSFQLSLDLARLRRGLGDPRAPSSLCCGSARKLEDGNWLIGWGGAGTSSPLTPHGRSAAPLRPTSRPKA